MNSRARERMLQLLADQVTEGLDAEHVHELNRLLAMDLDCDAHAYERAAAAADIAMAPAIGDLMPAELRDRLLMDAGRFFGGEAIA